MSDGYASLSGSPQVRSAEHVAYSLRMLGEITSKYDQRVDAGDFLAASCMIDTYYVHVRLLAEFLVKPNSRDLGPADFGVSWRVNVGDESCRLLSYWDEASKYVVHFGRKRIPNDPSDIAAFDVGGRHWRTMSSDVVRIFKSFLEEVEREASAWNEGALIPDRASEPNRWVLRLRAEQAGILRDAFAKLTSALA